MVDKEYITMLIYFGTTATNQSFIHKETERSFIPISFYFGNLSGNNTKYLNIQDCDFTSL